MTDKKKTLIKSLTVGTLSLVLLVFIDQFTKFLADTYLNGKEPFIIIKDVFELTYLENRGAAFGLLENYLWLFILGSIITLIVAAYLYFKLPITKRYRPLHILCVFISAGAVGNLIDRLVNNYVIDFFYFSLIDFPVFNVADCYVTVSTTIFLILFLFYYKEEDFNFLSLKNNKKIKNKDSIDGKK